MKNGKSWFFNAAFSLILIFSVSLFAQSSSAKTSNDISKVVSKLQQKVLLSDEQANNVKSVITSYISSGKEEENLSKAQNQILSILDEKQKAKYDIIKDDWWKNVNKISTE